MKIRKIKKRIVVKSASDRFAQHLHKLVGYSMEDLGRTVFNLVGRFYKNLHEILFFQHKKFRHSNKVQYDSCLLLFGKNLDVL